MRTSNLSVFGVLLLIVVAGCGSSGKMETSTTPSAQNTAMPATSETLPAGQDANSSAQVTAGTAMTANTAMAPKTEVAVNTSLKVAVEAAYTNLVNVLSSGDKTAFLGLMDSEVTVPTPSDEEWQKALPYIRHSYPNLADTKFVTLEQKTDSKVYYYFLSYLQDKKYTTVNVVIFDKINGSWRVSGNEYTTAFSKNTDPVKEQTAIDKAVVELRAKADKN
jgi:hypothetical protein